jgi:carboxylate-amine ligase
MDYQLANHRAAVPSFDRGVIAITVADMQECVSSDAAVAEMTVAVVNAMKAGRWVSNYLQRAWHETDLRAILLDIARLGGDAVITHRDYLLMFGMMRESATAGELWRHLYQQLRGELSEASRVRIAHILDHGCLARRILRRTGERPSRDRMIDTYRELCDCLKEDRPFI